jgi:nucleotide-binding universal stress UspA family protein
LDLSSREDHGVPVALLVCMEAARSESPMDTSKIRIERVLCGVTFSPSADRVVEWTASLAGTNDGEVRLFHALQHPDEWAGATSEADSERALKKLFALARQLPGRPRISAAVTEGDAAREILRHAGLVNADLIAVGMHAHDGSVSPLVTRLAIEAPCPVLVVDERATPPTNAGEVDRIVVAVNFLPASLAAADYAFALARAVGAQVTVVHVLPEHWEERQRGDPNVDETWPLVERHFRRLLQIAVSTTAGTNRDQSEVVASGRPCLEIVRLANVNDADLVVMGIDARPKSPHEFGETTSCVMQFARRTVLLVPERLFGDRRRGSTHRSH